MVSFWSNLRGKKSKEPTLTPAEQPVVNTEQNTGIKVLGEATFTPVVMSRFEDLFKREEWNYEIDADGDLTTSFDNCGFFIHLSPHNQEKPEDGVRIAIVGQPSFIVQSENLAEAESFIYQWHRSKWLPKAYTVELRDEEGVRILLEHTAFFGKTGATDAQLERVFRAGVATALEFVEEFVKSVDTVSREES